MYLILGEADRDRLGAPERLPVDLSTISNREAMVLKDLGFRTTRMFRMALLTVPVDKDGNEVSGPDAVLASEGGRVADYLINYEAWTGLVWLVLRRAGITTDVGELDFSFDGMRTEPDAPTDEAASGG